MNQQSGRGRPVLHFTPRAGWLNDPHAITARDGRYHMFYQANPDAPEWSPAITWGHAVSEDLVTWEEQPPALSPAPDEVGCWTGCLVQPPGGEAVVFYTSPPAGNLDLGEIRSAHPVDDSWGRWTPGDVVLRPPVGEGITMFRDPFVLPGPDGWRMLVGASRGGTPLVLGYTSPDLRRWTSTGVFAESDGTRWLGDGWECPQVARVDGRDVLVVSVWQGHGLDHHVAAAVGRLGQDRFETDEFVDISVGVGMFAPCVFADADGHPTAIFWIRHVGDGTWAGAQSIPYRLRVEDGRVQLSPHPGVRESTIGSAALHRISWRPQEGDVLILTDADAVPVARLRRERASVVVQVDDRSESLPLLRERAVDVVADGGILEVCTGDAVSALPIADVAGWSATPHRRASPW